MLNQLLDDEIYLNKISCETEVYLQVVTPTQRLRLKTRLIGVDPNMSVILAMGKDEEWDAAKEFIREGQKVIVRMVNGNQSDAYILAFQSQIQKQMSIAGNWLVLDYPATIQKVALRQHSRLPIDMKASILNLGSKKELSPGVLTDISIDGGAFIGEALPGDAIDRRYILQVKHEKSTETIQVMVKNSQKLSKHNNLVQYGFNLESKEDVTKKFVEELVLYYLFN